MNRYPTWKYLLILIILVLGALYAWPNVFDKDPALQLTSASGFQLPGDIVEQVESSLSGAAVEAAEIFRDGEKLVLRMPSTEAQEAAESALEETFTGQYALARSTLSATPGWLRALGGKPMTLGLDLQGGIYYLMEVDMDTALDQQVDRIRGDVRTTLRGRKINNPVRSRRNTVVVEFRDDASRQEALRVLRNDQSLTNLNFVEAREGEDYVLRINVNNQALNDAKDSAIKQNMLTLRNRVNGLGVAEPIIQQQGADRIVVQMPGFSGDAREILEKSATLEYRAVAEGNAAEAERSGRIPSGTRLYQHKDGYPVLLKRQLIASGDQLTGAIAQPDPETGTPSVSVTLDAAGGKRMQEFTSESVGKPMAVVYVEQKPGEKKQETVISIATIRGVFGRQFQTTGLDSFEEAGQLALLLKAGALAAPMKIVEQRTVGPSLGQDNIEHGFRAVLIGFALVLVFMALYYRVFGLIADVALMTNLVLLISLLSLLGATLTLPGIAGIVLTVGMAVDANVLIFERIREELRNGNTPQASIRAGYAKAFSTIADANITTLIAAFVLLGFGTGPVKGFAVTLSLGIITSMFTAIMVTRALVNLTYGRRNKVASLAI